MNLESHLIDLSNTPGVSGYERPIRDALLRAWEPLADELTVDPMGSLTATLRGQGEAPRHTIMVTAHMDEIGLMVTRIEDGFIRITSVGGIDRRVLPAQPVIVHGREPLPGLIAAPPPHILSAADRKKYADYDDLIVDTGLPAAHVAELVQIGDIVTFDQQAIVMSDGLVTGKAMDNRASVACMTRLLDLLQSRTQLWDVHVVATVQEETGLKGGGTIAWQLQPDIAIVVDTTWGIGVGVSDEKGFKLGDGPTLLIGPDAHPRLFHLITDLADELEFKLKPEVAAGNSGTEATTVKIARSGIPTAILSIPIRNMHSPVEVVAVKDIERTARLIAAFIGGLNGETLDKLRADEEE